MSSPEMMTRLIPLIETGIVPLIFLMHINAANTSSEIVLAVRYSRNGWISFHASLFQNGWV